MDGGCLGYGHLHRHRTDIGHHVEVFPAYQVCASPKIYTDIRSHVSEFRTWNMLVHLTHWSAMLFYIGFIYIYADFNFPTYFDDVYYVLCNAGILSPPQVANLVLS